MDLSQILYTPYLSDIVTIHPTPPLGYHNADAQFLTLNNPLPTPHMGVLTLIKWTLLIPHRGIPQIPLLSYIIYSTYRHPLGVGYRYNTNTIYTPNSPTDSTLTQTLIVNLTYLFKNNIPNHTSETSITVYPPFSRNA